MKTKEILALFPAVFAIVAMLISCTSVGYATESVISRNTYIASQIIMSKKGERVCVKLDPITKCGRPVKCGTDTYIDKDRIPVQELLKVDYVEVPGSPCNSFTVDRPGNTSYYCSGGYCYPY